jgi:hypothetical protein
VKFEQVLREADERPLGSSLLYAAQQELTKASRLLHLAEGGSTVALRLA